MDCNTNNDEELTLKRSNFIRLLSNQFITHNLAEHVADSYADQAMREFEESEGTTVNDPDYVWGLEGAEIMAAEFISNHLTGS